MQKTTVQTTKTIGVFDEQHRAICIIDKATDTSATVSRTDDGVSQLVVRANPRSIDWVALRRTVEEAITAFDDKWPVAK